MLGLSMGKLLNFQTKPDTKDFLTVINGEKYAGTHLIVDIWDGKGLDDLKLMEQTLLTAVKACGATLLHIHLHHFNDNGGISGVAVLAESHISVHSWPEIDYCAMDVFMCGVTEPHKAIDIFKTAFQTENVEVRDLKRGAIKK
jgi:S-adenosylmethionine decarboxylase